MILFYLKIGLIQLWLMISSLAWIIIACFRWGNTNLNRDFARTFAWGALKIAGIKVHFLDIEKIKPNQPCILVPNHQSSLDMAVYGFLFPENTLVIGKKEVKYIPLFGLFFAAAGNIFLDRQNRGRAIDGILKAAREVKRRKASVWIFAEGTRNPHGTGLLPFKKGAFHMAIEAGVPILPIVTSPMKGVANFVDRVFTRGTLQVRVLDPISTEGMVASEVDQLIEIVRARMLEGLETVHTQVTG